LSSNRIKLRVLIGLLLVGTVWSIAMADSSFAPRRVPPRLRGAGDDLAKFLGKDARIIANQAGDTVLLSKEGLRHEYDSTSTTSRDARKRFPGRVTG